jgi:hypothetical protein
MVSSADRIAAASIRPSRNLSIAVIVAVTLRMSMPAGSAATTSYREPESSSIRTTNSPQRGKTLARKPSASPSCSVAAIIRSVVWPLPKRSLALLDISSRASVESRCLTSELIERFVMQWSKNSNLPPYSATPPAAPVVGE